MHGYFKGAKGLRQGDPISQYMFSISMIIFSSILNDKPMGFKHHWRCQDLGITHLFFTDDMLFFCYGDRASIGHIMHSIDKFSKLSGLSPNMLKSTSFFSNCNANVLNWFDGMFGIPHGTLLVKLLRVPLISSKLSINDCMPLIEKITNRVHNWALKTLSFAGRSLLLKVVLLSI